MPRAPEPLVVASGQQAAESARQRGRHIGRNVHDPSCCTAVWREISVAGHHCRAVSLPEASPARAAVHHGLPRGPRAGDAARYGSAAKCRGVVAARYGPQARLPAVLRRGMNQRRNPSANTPCATSRRGVSRPHCKAAWVSIQPSGRGGGAVWTGIGVPRGTAARYGRGSKRRRAGAVRCGCGSKCAATLPCGAGAGRNARRNFRAV
jgi:hypothetical protein